jgi:hypothetical protein
VSADQQQIQQCCQLAGVRLLLLLTWHDQRLGFCQCCQLAALMRLLLMLLLMWP